MADLYSANLSEVQADRGPEAYKEAPGSTDMGDVSHVLPAIHPMFYIGGTAVNHTRAFAADSGEIWWKSAYACRLVLYATISLPMCLSVADES